MYCRYVMERMMIHHSSVDTAVLSYLLLSPAQQISFMSDSSQMDPSTAIEASRRNILWVSPRVLCKSQGAVYIPGYCVSHRYLHPYYITACGGVFNEPGEITSPYWPDSYPHSKTCRYLISAPEDRAIKVTFDTFQIEGNPLGGEGDNCTYDYLLVSTSPTMSSYRTCYTHPKAINKSSGAVKLALPLSLRCR